MSGTLTAKLFKVGNTGTAARQGGAVAFSESALQRWLIAAALFALPLALLAFHYKAMFPGLVNDDALDFAQLGRNLSQGRGFVTYFLRPLALTHGVDPLRQPDVTHGPLYPFLLALAFGARGATDSVVAMVSGLFYVLTVPLVYLLGARVFSRPVGLLAALVFAVNALMLEYAISGLHITLYVFLTTTLLLVLYDVAARARNRAEGRGPALPRAQLVLAGALTGALYLTDPIFVWIAPAALGTVIALSAPSQRARAALLFLLPLGVLALPWMWRNGVLTGNPVFGLRGMEVWMGTRGYYPGSLAYRMTPEDMTPGVGLFQAVVRKLLLGAGEVVQVFPQVSASWMLAFLLPSLLFRFTDEAVNSLRRVMMYCFVGLLAGSLLLGIRMPVFVSLIPTMLVFAIAYLLHLVEQARLPRRSVALLAGLLSAAAVLPVLHDMVLGDRPPKLADAATARIFGPLTGRNQVVLSDQPWLIAWYADRPAIWIPAVDNKIAAMRRRFPQARWLFLTEETRGFSPEWKALYDVFRRWNQAALEATMARKSPPDGIRIAGKGAPLLEGLEGFTTVNPLNGAALSTVLMAAPEKSK